MKWYYGYNLPDATNSEGEFAQANNFDLIVMPTEKLLLERGCLRLALFLAEHSLSNSPPKRMPWILKGRDPVPAARWMQERISTIEDILRQRGRWCICNRYENARGAAATASQADTKALN